MGRLIKVTEQNVSSGTLNQETTYIYNLLDKLTGVNQGNQTDKIGASGEAFCDLLLLRLSSICGVVM